VQLKFPFWERFGFSYSSAEDRRQKPNVSREVTLASRMSVVLEDYDFLHPDEMLLDGGRPWIETFNVLISEDYNYFTKLGEAWRKADFLWRISLASGVVLTNDKTINWLVDRFCSRSMILQEMLMEEREGTGFERKNGPPAIILAVDSAIVGILYDCLKEYLECGPQEFFSVFVDTCGRPINLPKRLKEEKPVQLSETFTPIVWSGPKTELPYIFTQIMRCFYAKKLLPILRFFVKKDGKPWKDGFYVGVQEFKSETVAGRRAWSEVLAFLDPPVPAKASAKRLIGRPS